MFRSETLKAELSVVVFCSLWSYQIIVLQSGWRMTNCRFRCKHRPSIPLTFPLLWGLTSACWLKSWPLLKLFSHSQQSKLWAAKWKWNRPANIVHSKCSDCLNWCLSFFASSRSHLFFSCQTLRYFTCCLDVEENNEQRKHSLGHQLSDGCTARHDYLWVKATRSSVCISQI